MNIAAIQTLLAVVETGNLNKAADRLNVTQSTVTARLDALEASLGQPLLVRSRRGAQLTRAGFAFQRHAEVMVQAWDQGRSAVGLPRGFSGLFSFACQFDLWESAGAKWLEVVRRAQPDLAMEAWPGAVSEIKLWLANGLTDAALVMEPTAGPGMVSTEIARERLVQVSTVRRQVRKWDPDYILVDLGPDFRRQHAVAWPGDETASMTFGSSRWALDHLLSNGGSAYLPWGLVAPLLGAGRLFPVDRAPEFSRGLHLVRRETSGSSFPWVDDGASWAAALSDDGDFRL